MRPSTLTLRDVKLPELVPVPVPVPAPEPELDPEPEPEAEPGAEPWAESEAEPGAEPEAEQEQFPYILRGRTPVQCELAADAHLQDDWPQLVEARRHDLRRVASCGSAHIPGYRRQAIAGTVATRAYCCMFNGSRSRKRHNQ